MKAKIFLLMNIVICSFILTGCWDRVEIEERAYITTLGIDVKEDEFEISFSVPNLPVITGQGTGSSEAKKYVKSIMGSSLLDTEMKYVENNGLILSVDHIKIIILGKELLENDKMLKDVVDYLSRNTKYTKSTLIIGTDGTAKDLANVNPESVKLTGEYVSQLINRVAEEEHNAYKLNLGELIVSLSHNEGLEIIPVINVKEKDIALDGVNIIDGFKSVCRLSKDETRILNWLVGVDDNAIVNFVYEDEDLDYKLTEMRRVVTVEKKDSQLEIEINIYSEGDVNGFLVEQDQERLDNETLTEIQEKINESMEEDLVQVMKKIQDEVGRDILQLSDSVKIYNQQLWIEIGEDWDDYFESANIKIVVDNNIRRIGIIE